MSASDDGSRLFPAPLALHSRGRKRETPPFTGVFRYCATSAFERMHLVERHPAALCRYAFALLLYFLRMPATASCLVVLASGTSVMSHIAHHISHTTHRTSHTTNHMSNNTNHTSYITHHTSIITHHHNALFLLFFWSSLRPP